MFPLCSNFSHLCYQSFPSEEDHENQLPVRLVHRPEVGRCLVASRNIKMGELVLLDRSAAFGPAECLDHGERPEVCIICCALNTKERCSNCNLPLCKECAELHRDEHPTSECEILKEISKDLHLSSALASIVPLRLFLTAKDHPNVKSNLDLLMDHAEMRKKELPEHVQNCEKILKVFSSHEKETQLQWTEEDWQTFERCFGITYVNAISLEGVQRYGRILFPNFSFLSHSCVNNCRHVVTRTTGGFEIRLYSQVDIPEGEELTITYTNLLRSTYERQKKLREKWFFKCICKRCTDPTELGTMIGSPVCPQCKKGYLLPRLESNDESWRCDGCEKLVAGSAVDNLVKMFLDNMEDTENQRSIGALENHIELCSQYFHKNHFLNLIAKRYLIQLYDKSQDKSQMERGLKACEDILEVLDVLDPGRSQSRGLTLLEKLDYDTALAGQDNHSANNVQDKLEEIKHCLIMENKESLSGKRLKKCLENYDQFTEMAEHFSLK